MTETRSITMKPEIHNHKKIREIIDNKKFSRVVNELLAEKYNINIKEKEKEVKIVRTKDDPLPEEEINPEVLKMLQEAKLRREQELQSKDL